MQKHSFNKQKEMTAHRRTGSYDNVMMLATGQQQQDHEAGGEQQAGPFRDLGAHPHPAEPDYRGECHHEHQGENEEAQHYSFSSGKTFTSTRRFFLLCSRLLASVIPGSGLSQPLPMTLNLSGSNLYLAVMALRTASARS